MPRRYMIDVPSLRQRVETAHHGRRFVGPVAAVRFAGGPLDGVQAIMPATEARAMFIAWAVLTEIGVVQLVYRRQSGEPGVFAFDEIDSRTCRA